MSVEKCPYCGKPFKRLKTHLPHCKMAPVAQPVKSIQAPKELSATTSRQKIHRKTTNDVIFDERLTSKSRRKEDTHNANSLLTNTEVKVSSSETLDMERPKSKWLAKRQREVERLQLLVPVSKKPSNPTSLSKHEGDKSFSEISKGPNQGTSQSNGKSTKGKKKMAPLPEQLSIITSKINTPGFVPAPLKNSRLASECNVQHENPKLKTKVHFLEELERLTNSQNKNFDLVSRAKEDKAHAFFTSKTSVWDHINYSLYYKRSYNPFVPYPIIETSKDSALETMQQSNKPETAVTKVAFPSLTLSETIHQPAEDILNSRLQDIRSLSCSSETVTAYNRIQFSTVPLGSYANENIWKKDQFPGASSQSEAPLVQRKLGDVRLNELGVWLAARTPVSPGEIVTMLKQEEESVEYPCC
ncbi:uncharacterized protein si:dkey-21c1.4 isoform X3 [Ctenopharyngodon idella]|uniref:uncharacterized protein si:dkey-21c1.4 isoform X3 n=1 Tax=Ctenopharyngodon idella TaxID=7959 RepID=UPI002230454C|nr:uncharacterized protein si:dkey-21c1.4 isoform X3 [Ctenopharyngodon idella]